jgi:tetratricopeptide (TPR) repeat protein
MYSLLISLGIALAVGLILGIFVNVGLGIFLGIFAFFAAFIFFQRTFSKKLQAIFMAANIEIQKQHFDRAIEILKEGYRYNKYAFLVQAQIDTQIGIIIYSQKKFGEAFKYLKNSNPRIMMGYLMYIIGCIKNKNTENIDKNIDLLIRFNKKDPFVYSAVAYLYEEELDNRDKALETLTKAAKIMPDNPKIKEHLLAFQNNKEFKMDKYGEQWYQLMLDRKGLTRLQNKMIKNQQKSMGVRTFTR